MKSPKVDEAYDRDVDRVMNCISCCLISSVGITSTRNAYKAVESEASRVYEKYKEGVSSSDSYPAVLKVPALDMSFDLSVLNDPLLVEKENEASFLTTLRAIFNRVKSVDAVAMLGNEVSIHMKEEYDLKVVVERDANHAVTLKSATVVLIRFTDL